jgi:hypothetical protein
MELAAIEPHPDFGRAFEMHVFECRACHKTQTYTLRLRAPADGPPLPPVRVRPPRQRP